MKSEELLSLEELYWKMIKEKTKRKYVSVGLLQ
jgi:hypothetical protein